MGKPLTTAGMGAGAVRSLADWGLTILIAAEVATLRFGSTLIVGAYSMALLAVQ